MARREKKSADTNGSAARRRGPRRWLRRLLARMLLLASVALALFAVVLYFFARRAAAIDISALDNLPERTMIHDFRGREIGALHGENRVFIPLADVSPHMIDAVLAREDNRFYKHGGVDWFGVARSMVRNLEAGEIVQGGSTITMQLSRNRFPLGGRTYGRKILEAMLARRLEARYSKDQILEAYLNIIYFGSGQYGIAQASKTYFEKPAANLNLAESAMLAGLIRSPNTFSPFRNEVGARREMADVLDRMAATGRIEQRVAEATKKAVPHLRPESRRWIADTWAMDLVRRELDLFLEPEHVARGGLRVFTSLDIDLQNAAEAALEDHLASFETASGYPFETRAGYAARLAALPEDAPQPEPAYLQGAVVVIDPFSGGIRAMVGGRDPQHSRFNRAWQARRQVGSLFKPFVYTAAWQRGLKPGQQISDGPLAPGEIAGAARNWQPRNADRTYQGMQPAWWGLVKSRNTMSVRVGNTAGLDNVRAIADQAGLHPNPPRFPSIYLGSFESTLRDLTAAYTAFPRGGSRARPFVISEIQDRDGRLVFRSTQLALPVCSKQSATTTSNIMRQVMQPGGTGASAARFGADFPSAGKTGTTDNYRDAWFVGYTSLLVGGVWVGFDSPRQSLSEAYGSRMALPVWARLMSAARDSGYKFGPLP